MKILVTVVLIAGAIAVWAYIQPSSAKKPVRTISNALKDRPQLGKTMHGIGEGKSPWMKRFDPKTGELASQIIAEQWDPQKDNTVNVTKPVAEFYSGDGKQLIKITGAHGNIVLPPTADEKPSNANLSAGAQPAMPSRGKLNDVMVSVYDPVDAPEPMITATMNNAAFDTDNFRIATEAYKDEKGNTIEADQVPVKVRGRDIDFDGRGLIIRWNERDRKLQLLQIEHGDSLILKNPEALGHSTLVPTTQSSAGATGEMLVSVDPTAHRLVLTAAKPKKKPPSKSAKKKKAAAPATTQATTQRSTRDTSPVVYRATFDQEVTIHEAGEQVASGKTLFVDLLQEQKKSSTQPASTQPTSKPARSHTTRHATTATSQPDKKASDSDIKGPIVVKWTGKLKIVPVEGPADPALQPGKAVVHLRGEPATLTRTGMHTTCGEAVFNSASNAALLLPISDQSPIVLTSDDGWNVKTPRVEYAQSETGTRTATLKGKSVAEVPMTGSSSPTTKPTTMHASWDDQCVLLMKDEKGSSTMDRADLTGNVKIDHPDMRLKSNALRLTFDPAPTTRKSTTQSASTAPTTIATTKKSSTKPADMMSATLREILATGDVQSTMLDPQNPRTIDTDSLRVRMAQSADDQPYPQTVTAEGNVRTTSGKNAMQAGKLIAHLAPATKPTTRAMSQPAIASSQPTTQTATTQPFGTEDLHLVSLLATDHIVITGEDSTATADELHVDPAGDQYRFTLIGKPFATLVSGKANGPKSTITGPTITFDPEQSIAAIVGGGKVDAVDPDDAKKNMKLAWAGDATINDKTNLVDLDREVVMQSLDPSDGTLNTASANHLQAVMTTKPSTQPAKVATTAPAKKKSHADLESISFMKDKEISAGTLSGNVNITSETRDASGLVLRGLLLKAEQAKFDQAAGRMEIPVEGQMLYQNHGDLNKPATQPADPNAKLGADKGETAFKWNKSLIYDQAARQAVMSGNVTVIHRPQDEKGESFRLTGETLTATFTPKPTTQPTAQPSTKPSTNPADQMGKLKLITVVGDVKAFSSKFDIEADELTFDPESEVVTAKGDPRHPVTLNDNAKGSTSTLTELYWNTKTDEIRVKELRGKL